MEHIFLKEKIINYNDDVNFNGVYLIYHVKKPSLNYVGSIDRKYNKKKSKNGCYRRWVEHYNRLRNNTHHSKFLQNTVNKYGIDGVRFMVIERTDMNIRERELFYIKKYNSYIQGYNSTDKTYHGVMSNIEIKKQSERMKKNNPMKNSQSVEKLRNTRLELFPALVILQYDVDGNFIKEWKSTEEAGNALKINSSNINRCITNKTKTSGRFLWFYKLTFTDELLLNKIKKYNTKYKQSNERINNQIKSQNKIVLQYDLDYIFIREFISIKEAGIYIGCHPSNISRCCNGYTKSCNGFIWKKK